MDIEACRIEFMEWLHTRPEVLNIGYDPKSGKFVLREDQERWEAWQASRECRAVELPKWEEYSGDDEGVAHAIFDCAKAIKVVGVKIK